MIINEPNREIAGAFGKDQKQRWRKREGMANRKKTMMVARVKVKRQAPRLRWCGQLVSWVASLRVNRSLNFYTEVLGGVVQGEIWI